jgi:proline iminopeptidase
MTSGGVNNWTIRHRIRLAAPTQHVRRSYQEVRPVLDWRATREERREPLPGDDLVPEARGSSTHAISIRAPARALWPWLVQMGCDRAGFYSHDRLDNAGRPSASRILPEFQDTKVGDILPSRPGSPHGFEVLRMEAPHLLLLGAFLRIPGISNLSWDATASGAYTRNTWLFLLRECGDEMRLVVRVRGIMRPAWLGVVVNAVMAPAHVMMQRKQLLNLRQRAEELASARTVG